MRLHIRQWLGGTAKLEQRLREVESRCAELQVQLDERAKQLDEANKTLRRMATIDPLTGIANHRRFRDFLESEWRRVLRDQAPMSVLIVDIDDVKGFNDAFGHQAGDECLRRVAGALSSGVGRPGDLVARYGGDEFVAVLGDTDVPGGLVIGERLRAKVEALAVPHPRSPFSGSVTVSVGVATLRASPHASPDDLVTLADAALVAAKRDGRNRVSGAPDEPPRVRPSGQVLQFRSSNGD
ncbi:MAG: diguanylate cyclase [Acidobacteria bacterium]|nr:diguanylate cyclase [Acidobacteriota bacterium]